MSDVGAVLADWPLDSNPASESRPGQKAATSATQIESSPAQAKLYTPFHLSPTWSALFPPKDPISIVVAVKGELAPLSAQPDVVATMSWLAL